MIILFSFIWSMRHCFIKLLKCGAYYFCINIDITKNTQLFREILKVFILSILQGGVGTHWTRRYEFLQIINLFWLLYISEIGWQKRTKIMTNCGSPPYTDSFITVRTIYHNLINNFLFYLHKYFTFYSIDHLKIIISRNQHIFAGKLPAFILNFYPAHIHLDICWH